MIGDVDMNVTISGSYRKHLPAILRAREAFTYFGITVLRPTSDAILEDAGAFVRLEGDPKDPRDAARRQLDAIRLSRLLYVVNPGGYVGGSAMYECGFAAGLGVPVVFSEPPFEAAALEQASAIGDPGRAVAMLMHNTMLPGDATLLDDLRERGVAALEASGTRVGATYEARLVGKVVEFGWIDCDPLMRIMEDGTIVTIDDDPVTRVIAMLLGQARATRSQVGGAAA